jgi:hypothetical protein
MCRLSTTVGWLSGFPSCLVFVSAGCRRRLAARCVLSRFRVHFLLRFAVVRRPLFWSVVSVGPLVCCVFPVAVCRLSVGSFLGLPARFWVFPAALLRPLLSRLSLVFRAMCALCLHLRFPAAAVVLVCLGCGSGGAPLPVAACGVAVLFRPLGRGWLSPLWLWCVGGVVGPL